MLGPRLSGTFWSDRGVTALAKEIGIGREGIAKGFRAGGNPTLDTHVKAARALGLKLAAVWTGAG